MTPADLTLIRALIRDVRAHFDGRGISGPMALRLADACEMLMLDHERQQSLFSGLLTDIHGLIDVVRDKPRRSGRGRIARTA